MLKRTLIFAGLLSIGGCTMERPRAIVNDLAPREGLDSGYALVAVDGQAVERAGHGEPSPAPPFAWVESGEHKLTLRPKLQDANDPSQREEMTITAKLEPYKRYRLAKDKDEVRLVEDF